ncbi:MAG: hypothetical protein ABIH23_29510, partial [bacterium]
VEGGGLLGGLTALHFRMLCENPWNGGGGCLIRDVMKWSLDQIWFMLCKAEVLKRGTAERTEQMEPTSVKIDDDGFVRGRAADGTPIRGRIGGKSLARQLMEQEEEKRKKQEAWQKRRKRRKGK